VIGYRVNTMLPACVELRGANGGHVWADHGDNTQSLGSSSQHGDAVPRVAKRNREDGSSNIPPGTEGHTRALKKPRVGSDDEAST